MATVKSPAAATQADAPAVTEKVTVVAVTTIYTGLGAFKPGSAVSVTQREADELIRQGHARLPGSEPVADGLTAAQMRAQAADLTAQADALDAAEAAGVGSTVTSGGTATSGSTVTSGGTATSGSTVTSGGTASTAS